MQILLRRHAVVPTLRRRRRVLVILDAVVPLENADNLAEDAFLLLGLFFSLDTGSGLGVPAGLRRPVGGRRRQRLLRISSEYAREEALHPAASLVAGIVRLRPGYKGDCVIV